MKDLVRKKLYSIALMDLGSETLVMLGGVTNQVELEDRSGGKRARPERHDLTG